MRRFLSFCALFALFASFIFVLPAHAANPWAPNTAYAAGAQVTYNGQTYQCLQAHTSQVGWEPPNVAALWKAVGGGTTATPTTPTPATPTPITPTPPPSGCSYTDWVAGKQYYTGNIVRYKGSFYIAEHDNPGYDPTVSTWFWDPHTCGGNPTPTPVTPTPATPTPTPPPTCNYPNWAAGTQYYTGNIVRYNGSFYIAEHDNPGYDPTVSTWFWDPYTCNGNPTPTPTTPPGSGFASIVSRAQFEQMFPSRNSFYTYDGLVTAAAFYPAFAGTGSTETRKREAAAALANFAHETGGLIYIVEQNTANYPHYCDPNQSYGCPAGQAAYYGRGPIQLSWNFNYKAAGDALGINLLGDPWQVERDPAVAWKTALWYWMTQRGPGTMTPHDAMVNNRGFGETIRSINGSIECNGGNSGQVQSRVTSYQRITGILGVTPGDNLYC